MRERNDENKTSKNKRVCWKVLCEGDMLLDRCDSDSQVYYLFVVCTDDECKTFCCARSVSSWKNTLVITISPVLSVWHVASDIVVVVVAALLLPLLFVGVTIRPIGGRTGDCVDRDVWQLQTHRFGALQREHTAFNCSYM